MTQFTYRKTEGPHLIEHPDIRLLLSNLINKLHGRVRRLNGDAETWTGWTADALADGLAGRSSYLGPSAAADLVLNYLMDPSELTNAGMWGSPLGRALAYWGTGESYSISRACAAAALHCTRANVSLMVRKGELSEPVGHEGELLITTASLAHAMRVRHPLREVL